MQRRQRLQMKSEAGVNWKLNSAAPNDRKDRQNIIFLQFTVKLTMPGIDHADADLVTINTQARL